MAKKPNQGRAGIFRPWDGKLTGPQPGEPAPMPDRNQSWSSVQKKQNQMFTVEDVEQIVAKAVAAVKEGREVPPIEVPVEEEKEELQEEFKIGGK